MSTEQESRPQRPGRPYGERHAARHFRDYREVLPSPWVVLGIGALAGVATAYYFSGRDAYAVRFYNVVNGEFFNWGGGGAR